MSLVPSLLQAIVGVDGEALVMHAGDKPYVVAPSGQIELASRGLTLEAVNGIVSQLLPADALQRARGVRRHPAGTRALPEFPGESFTVVAARGGDDVWVEIRRRKVSDDDQVPDDFFAARRSASPRDQSLHARPPAPTTRHRRCRPAGHPGRSEEQRPRGRQHDELHLGPFEVPDAAQLFESQRQPSTPEPAAFRPERRCAASGARDWRDPGLNPRRTMGAGR